MTNHAPTRARTRARISAALLLAASGLALTACDQDSNARILNDASTRLAALGGAQAATEEAANAYQKVITSLQPVSNASSDGQKAAAQIMIARAHLGTAGPDMLNAAARDRLALALASEVRGHLNSWIELTALANAVDRFNPDEELRTIQSQVAELNQRVQATRARLAERQEEIATLESQSADFQRRADFDRTAFEEVRNRALEAAPVEAQELAAEARELQRRADQLAVSAERLTARAEGLRPTLGEIQLEIDEIQTQRELLEASTRVLQDKRAEATRERDEIMVQANQTAARLHETFGELMSVRDDAETARTEALDAVDQAVRAARQARNLDRASASLVAGETLHARAGILRERSHALASTAELLDRLIEIEPALPNRSDYLGMITEIRERLETTQGEAAEAFGDAADALGSVNPRGLAGERLDRAVVSLEMLAGRAQDDAVDGAAEGAMEPQAEGEAPEPTMDEPPTLPGVETPPPSPPADAGGGD